MPPLRELGEDRLKLLDHYRALYADEGRQPAVHASTSARARAGSPTTFPGNVRELKNIVIRLTTKYAGYTVGEAELEAEFAPPAEGAERARSGRARARRAHLRASPSASTRP